MIFAVILAGGIGSRVGAECPKQFLNLGDKTILFLSTEKFIFRADIDKIIVVCHNDYISFAEKIFYDYAKVTVISGGISRNSSLENAIEYVKINFKICENDIIITQDAARPFLTNEIIDANIKALEHYDAAGTAIASTDTVFVCKDELFGESLSREKIFRAQTPQTFRLKKLINCINSLSEKEKESLTDACQIFQFCAKDIKIVTGSELNFKITTQLDLKFAKYIIEANS